MKSVPGFATVNCSEMKIKQTRGTNSDKTIKAIFNQIKPLC